MFPLQRPDLPTSADELASAIMRSLRSFTEQPRDFVTIQGTDYPAITDLRVNLSGARIASIPPRPPAADATGKRAFAVQNLYVGGDDIDVLGAPTDLTLEATGVELHEARDGSGNVVLLLNSAQSGELRFAMAKAALEKLIQTFGKREAAKHGVTLESVNIKWTSRGTRGVDANVTVQARKFFLSATVNVSGSLDIGDDLSGKLSALRCNGDGALAGIACSALTPQLQKFNGREFSLRALPIGELAVRDLQITASDRLEIRATFGSAT